jgi:WbqC-like protein family
MKIGIMQPYLFPYLGYWQHIFAVDKFIILDDVNFIKRGYINRNNILLNGASSRFTLPLINASQNKLISETYIVDDENKIHEILSKIRTAYKEAPFFEVVYSLIERIMLFNNRNLSKFITNSIIQLCLYMGIETEIVPSSKIYEKKNLTGQMRILDILIRENATTYINPIGGIELYDKNIFLNNGIDLTFLKMNNVSYTQFDNEFVPSLSIIDVLMFNSTSELKKLLTKFNLL